MNTSHDSATRSSVTTAATWAVVALVAASSAGCMNASIMPRPRAAGELALAVPVALRDATVEVTVTGTDIARPVTGQLSVSDGFARGTVEGITAGQNRLVLITATDRSGRRCSREVNAAVDALAVSRLEGVTLECEAATTRDIATASNAGWTWPPMF